jgi:hypothetical protein
MPRGNVRHIAAQLPVFHALKHAEHGGILPHAFAPLATGKWGEGRKDEG